MMTLDDFRMGLDGEYQGDLAMSYASDGERLTRLAMVTRIKDGEAKGPEFVVIDQDREIYSGTFSQATRQYWGIVYGDKS